TLSTFIDSSVLNSIAGQGGLAANFAPAGLRFGPDGNLYVALNGGQGATRGGGVIRFNLSGGAYAGTFAVVASGLVQPTEMTFGVGNDINSLYVSQSGAYDNNPLDGYDPSVYANSPHNVIKVARADSATPTQSVFIATSGQLNYPSGLTWGMDGK